MTLDRFFEDFSRSMNSFCMVARFKIISDQGAFDGPYERSRTMCFRFELLLQSLGACTNIFGKVLSPSDFGDFGRPCRGLSTWKGASPPAGPPKITKSLGESTFPKNPQNSKFHENLHFWNHAKNLSSLRCFLKRIDRHNEYIPG